jgi:hypothetical protein
VNCLGLRVSTGIIWENYFVISKTLNCLGLRVSTEYARQNYFAVRKTQECLRNLPGKITLQLENKLWIVWVSDCLQKQPKNHIGLNKSYTEWFHSQSMYRNGLLNCFIQYQTAATQTWFMNWQDTAVLHPLHAAQFADMLKLSLTANWEGEKHAQKTPILMRHKIYKTSEREGRKIYISVHVAWSV